MRRIDAIRELFFNGSGKWRAIQSLHVYLEAGDGIEFAQAQDLFADVFGSKVVDSLSLKASIRLVLCLVMCFGRFAPKICLKTRSEFQVFVGLLAKIFRFRNSESSRELNRIMDIMRLTDAFLLLCDDPRASELVEVFSCYSDVGADFAVNMIINAERWMPGMTDIVIRNIKRPCFAMGLRKANYVKQQFIIVEVMKAVKKKQALDMIMTLATLFDVDVTGMLEQMQMEMINENDKERLCTVSFCCSLVKNFKDHLPERSENVLRFLLKRHEDRVTDIRMLIVRLCFDLLDCPLGAMLDVTSVIKQRLCDPSAAVRLQCLTRKISTIVYNYDLQIQDKNIDVVKRIMDFWLEDFLAGCDSITIAPLLACYHGKSKVIALCALNSILHQKPIIEILGWLDRRTCVMFVQMVSDILDFQNDIESILCEFQCAVKKHSDMITYDLWSKYLPSKVVWKLWKHGNYSSLLSETDEQFVQELQATTCKICIDSHDIIHNCPDFVVQEFCKIMPRPFANYCEEVLHSNSILQPCDIIAVTASFGNISQRLAIVRLLSCNTDESITAFSRIYQGPVCQTILVNPSIIKPWKYKLKIAGEELIVDIAEKNETTRYRFLGCLLDKTLIPSSVFSTSSIQRIPSSTLKLIQRLSCIVRDEVAIRFNMKAVELRNDHCVAQSVMCLTICEQLSHNHIDQLANLLLHKEKKLFSRIVTILSTSQSYRATLLLGNMLMKDCKLYELLHAIEDQARHIAQEKNLYICLIAGLCDTLDNVFDENTYWVSKLFASLDHRVLQNALRHVHHLSESTRRSVMAGKMLRLMPVVE